MMKSLSVLQSRRTRAHFAALISGRRQITEIERTASVIEDLAVKGEHLMTIKTFSKRDSTVGKSVRSPEFQLLGSTWAIELYPSGLCDAEKGFLGVHLYNMGSIAATVRWMQVDMLDSNGRVLVTAKSDRQTISPGAVFAASGFMTHVKLLKMIDNDTLRLRVTLEKIETKQRLVAVEHDINQEFKAGVGDSLAKLAACSKTAISGHTRPRPLVTFY